MKLLLDENLSQPATKALRELVERTREPAEIQHLLDLCPRGILDPQWLPKFQDQNDPWLIITADAGKRCGGDRLPRICKELGIRHVLLSGKLHQRRQFDKIRALFAVWPDLKLANASNAGSRYKLQQAGESFVLKAA